MKKTTLFVGILTLSFCIFSLQSCSKKSSDKNVLDTVSSGPTWSGEPLDPYEIFQKHYDAMGGLENIRKEKSNYIEGNITIVGTGLEGTFKQWNEYPVKRRDEVDLTIITQTSGDDGDFSWLIDMNGKLQIQMDSNTVQERRITELLADYEHMNRNSEYFNLSFLGADTANGLDCYVIELKNNINEDKEWRYFDTSSYYLVKKIDFKHPHETHTIFSDYREIDGIFCSFRQEIEILPLKQKQVIEITRYDINPDIEDQIFIIPEEGAPDFVFGNGKSAENIPFDFVEDHIYIEVDIEGKKGLWILDCGASASVISLEYAQELGLDLQGSLTGQGVGGTVDVTFTTLPPFSLKGLEFKEQKVVALEIQDFMKKLSRMEVCGILGYDFLSRFVTKIDYANERISFYLPDSFEYKGVGTIINSPLEDNMFIVPVSVDDKYSGMWRLDIGATGLSFHHHYAEENDLLEIEGIESVAFGADGEISDKRALFDFVRIEDFRVETPVISIPTEPGIGAFSDRRYVGNLGNDILKHFVLYLDYQNQRIILEKGEDYSRNFPREKSGMAIWDTEEGVEIFFISPGTPSDRAKLKEGDFILAIDGKAIGGFETLSEIREIFRSEEGTKIQLKVKRGEEILDIELVLEELY